MLEKMPKINKSSPIPLYNQLKKMILDLIKMQELQPEDKLPSERKISKYHNISRMTVHKAIDELVQEQYLYREHGKGTFVASRVKPTVISPLVSFSEEMEKKGLSTISKLLDWKIINASSQIAAKLNLSENENVIQFERLRFVENKPFLREQVHLPQKQCPGLEKNDLENNSLYQILKEDYYYNLNYAEATVEPVLLKGKIAKQLKVNPETIGLLFTQVTYSDNNNPIEYTIAHYQSKEYKFKFKFGEKIN